jgi:hypothetical protein
MQVPKVRSKKSLATLVAWLGLVLSLDHHPIRKWLKITEMFVTTKQDLINHKIENSKT